MKHLPFLTAALFALTLGSLDASASVLCKNAAKASDQEGMSCAAQACEHVKTKYGIEEDATVSAVNGKGIYDVRSGTSEHLIVTTTDGSCVVQDNGWD